MTAPSQNSPLRIGTRGSPLALAQAHEARDSLAAAHGLPFEAFQIQVIKTTGDRITDRPLKDLGGKGLFTREIEDALSAGSIDIAVHSMKDMPVLQPAGLVIDCFLPREDVRDAFLSPSCPKLSDLPEGAVVGTSSLRRRAQLLARRPDLQVIEFRGNVQTRLRKLDEGQAAATFLAMAGLKRLGLQNVATAPIETDEMLPAVAQGAIGIERRADDRHSAALLEAISDADTMLRMAAERAYLSALDGSCETPIAGLATLKAGEIELQAEILRPDGSEVLRDAERGPVEDGAVMGQAVASRLLARAPARFFDWRT